MAGRIIRPLILLAITGAALYVFQYPVRTVAYQALSQVRPCTVPLTYKIGTVDPRFGLSRDVLLKDLTQATAIWNTGAGKRVFLYDQTHGVVTVNLEYDSRQATTEKLKGLGVAVQNNQSSYDALKLKYQSVYADYVAQKRAFESDAAAYDARQAAYEAEVKSWNAKGGAPKDVYARLNAEQQALQAQGAALKQRQVALNARVDDVNALVNGLNTMARALNISAANYNTVGKTNGSEFEEGVYISSLGKEEVDIFEYGSNAKLIRVLSHEFGHALGLDHVSDPQAIMYSLNQGDNERLTSADLTELKAHCGMQ